jgi:putative transposase
MLLGLNRSSVYYAPSVKQFSDETLALMRVVDEVYTERPFFGTRQMASQII